MKTIGLPISEKENEKRRCLLPSDVKNIKNKKYIFVEKGYGDLLGYRDEDYEKVGVKAIHKEEVLSKDIICDPKIGDADYIKRLNGQTVFGWVHAVQNRTVTDILIKNGLTAYAWEDMYEAGRHIFWRNNEIAGEAAIIHAYSQYGFLPYDTKVAIIGKGNIARGAYKTLTLMGADVTVYDRYTEKLFQAELVKYDVIVNAILWDISRVDHIIYKEDLKRMKRGAMIIDISCDRAGGVETCVPTSIANPVYLVDNVMHYAVDHTPSIFYKTTSACLSLIVSGFIDYLILDKPDKILQDALIIKDGVILDDKINKYQNR